MIKTKIIADSIYESDIDNKQHRVTTFELEYPRYIHSELKTHRVFSSNSASSRAIPIERMIELTTDNPVIPMWTLNQKGMSGIAVTNDDKIELANAVWLDALSNAVKSVEKLNDLGIHKQNANRLLEPFQHIKTILTGTDFDNFFNLRIAPEAQPEIELLAESMKRDYENSKPVKLITHKIHCPYFKNVSVYDMPTILTSVALCAQVSYRKENKDPETVRRIINRLMGCSRIHASPFEHVCMPNVFGFIPRGNLDGYVQLRHKVEDMKTGMDNRMKFTPDSDYYDELVRLGNIIWL